MAADPWLRIQVLSLLALQLASVVILWLLNPLTEVATNAFALFLSVNLVAFAMLSYIYRTGKSGGAPSRSWMLAGTFVLLLLLASNLAL